MDETNDRAEMIDALAFRLEGALTLAQMDFFRAEQSLSLAEQYTIERRVYARMARRMTKRMKEWDAECAEYAHS